MRTAANSRSSLAVTLLSAVTVGASVLSGCGSEQGSRATTSSRENSALSAGAATPTALSPSESLANLDGTLSYGSGEMKFSPPNPSFSPSVDSAQAYLNYQATGVYTDAVKYSAPTVELATYNNLGAGKVAEDGSLTLSYLNRQVWLVIFHNFPDVGSGGVGDANGSAPPSVERHDIVTVVDATSGTVLQTISAQADQ